MTLPTRVGITPTGVGKHREILDDQSRWTSAAVGRADRIAEHPMDKGECSVIEVLEELKGRREVARNTVQTMLTRLEDKGWLTHRESSGVFYFKPTVTREQAQQKAVSQLLETTFGGSAEDMVLALLGGSKLDVEELDRIRKLISEAKRSRAR